MNPKPARKVSQTNRIRREKTSLPKAGIWTVAAPLYEAALDIGDNPDLEHLLVDAGKWVRMVESWVDGSNSNDARVNGVFTLSQPDGIEAMRPMYLDEKSPFWAWYASNGEFVLELCSRVIRWRQCRGGKLQDRLVRFLLNYPGLQSPEVGIVVTHKGVTNGGTVATDEEIAEAFGKQFGGTIASAKDVGNARQRLFGPEERYRRNIERRIEELKRKTEKRIGN